METIARAFELESHRIDQLIWDAMALRSGETALFCGFSNNLEWIKRAVGIGVIVSVISNDATAHDFDGVPVGMLRGSTSILPARDASFDVTVAFHYLHEIDPFFHANVVTELGRVGKRCVIVEPAPPSDPLGLRIASLYSRAKRELGQFEHYHHIEYWRKLLAIVKPEVRAQTFNFMRTPPREAIRDTVSLIIDTMAAEATPETYLAELRALAARPDAQLVPQARYVIVGAASAVTTTAKAGTAFRTPEAAGSEPVAKPFVPPSVEQRVNLRPSLPTIYTSAEEEPEFPAVLPPAPPAAVAAPPAAVAAPPPPENDGSRIARNAFGLSQSPVAPEPPTVLRKPDEAEAAFGLGTASEDMSDFGWQWEPPDDGSNPKVERP